MSLNHRTSSPPAPLSALNCPACPATPQRVEAMVRDGTRTLAERAKQRKQLLGDEQDSWDVKGKILSTLKHLRQLGGPAGLVFIIGYYLVVRPAPPLLIR